MNTIKTFWQNLGNRERTWILAGVGVLALILAVQFVLMPFWDERQRLNRAIEAKEKTLEEMQAQTADLQTIKRDVDAIQRAIAARPPNFSLYAWVERKAGEAGVRQTVKSITPGKGLVAGSYEEVLADVNLEKVTLRQLVKFLYTAESPKDAVRVRRLAVRKTADAPDYLTATVQLITYQTAGGTGPRPAPRPGGQGA